VSGLDVLVHNACGPGNFPEKDIALGVHENLSGFKGNAKIGSDFKVTNKILIDTIKGGIDESVANGGKVRFNLDGFNPSAAVNPAHPRFNSYTSQEFRYVMQNHFFNTEFYSNGQSVPLPF
jgi:hypothetical protein